MEKTNQLKQKRKQKKMTQLELGKAVGVTESMISKLETGRAVASPELKERLAQELGCRTYEI